MRDALHIPEAIPEWEGCNEPFQNTYHSQEEGSLWIYKVLRHQIKIMFYSGDTDGAVTTYGSRRWITGLGWDVLEKYRPWYTNGQVSGYIEQYDGLDFVTIHGVGHMAPQWKREDTTNMIMAWIHGETF